MALALHPGPRKKGMYMKLKLIMADPAGNRTAIVRTPVPAAQRTQIAAKLLEIPELRAEQAGFETAPCMGGAGRLEMMGGEFCGNAARSYGYLLWRERNPRGDIERAENETAGSMQIEISGSAQPLAVDCDLEKGTSYAQMPLPDAILHTSEGYPLVVSEGITHVILQDMDPDEDLIRRLVEEYGDRWDAFGMMFLKGDRLTPVVYVCDAGSLVWESSCGSGSLAAAWYLGRMKHVLEDGTAGKSGANVSPVEETVDFRFLEPGGEISVRISRGQDGGLIAQMGGRISLEREIELELLY